MLYRQRQEAAVRDGDPEAVAHGGDAGAPAFANNKQTHRHVYEQIHI